MPDFQQDGFVNFGYENGNDWGNYDGINDAGWEAPQFPEIGADGDYGGNNYGNDYDNGGDYGGDFGGGDGGGDGGGY